MSTVFLAGSGWFGAEAARRLADAGHKIVGVSSPRADRRNEDRPDLLALWAELGHVPWVGRDALRPEDVPANTDVILAAHSHAFIGRRTRNRAAYALGYHPSLLPLHRGRDAVKWQARLRERVVGGSIYHLTDRVDGGPLHSQVHAVVADGITASELWREVLAPIGLEMLVRAAQAVEDGEVNYHPQDDALATWEPSFDSAPLYRPELMELPRGAAR
ncbi:tRNA-methyltransferase [Gordonia phage Sisko]|nr:tRNA-methyltransferase [Gordonia phage Sisko]